MRILVMCTHNSARSQIGEGWVRHFVNERGLYAEVWSAGSETTFVKQGAIDTMAEVDIDISDHTSKVVADIPDWQEFDVVLTVCDSANEACPIYPAKTTRLHVSFDDPSGGDAAEWARVRDQIKITAEKLVAELAAGRTPTEAAIAP